MLLGNLVSVDTHMNLVLGDCEEFRTIKSKSKEKGGNQVER